MIGALVNALAGRSLDTGLAGGGLKFNFLPRLFQRVDTDGDNMARTSNFANVATVTRASTKTDAGGWDFTSGGAVGTLTEYASGVAAIHSTAGLLVEESTTNQIRNPRFEGGTAGTIGSGGAWPTNMAAAVAGLSVDVSFGTESGAEYLEMRFYGTATNTQVNVWLESAAIITAAQNDTFTLSLGVRPVSQTGTGRGEVYGQLVAYNSTPAILGGNSEQIDNGVGDGGIRRVFTTQTISQAGTASVRPRFDVLGLTVSTAYDFTYRIYAPQLEQKAYPTSPVFPVVSSPAAATRAADYVALSLGAWFNEPTGTMFFEYQPNTAGVNGLVLGGFGDTFNNTAYISSTDAGTRWTGSVRSGASSSAFITPAGQSDYVVGASGKAALAYSQDDFAMSLNGATQATDATGNVPVSPTRFVIGGSPWAASAGNSFDGYIKDLRYWPKRLTNEELEALVGN